MNNQSLTVAERNELDELRMWKKTAQWVFRGFVENIEFDEAMPYDSVSQMRFMLRVIRERSLVMCEVANDDAQR